MTGVVENVITALEFDEVLKLLAAESVTPPGAARATLRGLTYEGRFVQGAGDVGLTGTRTMTFLFVDDAPSA